MPFYLVYTSLPRKEMSRDVLEEITQSSLKNNRANAISGILLGIESRYLQYLEGEKEKVLDLFHKIKMDGRHHGVTKWVEGTTDSRVFGDWSMASWMLSSTELSKLPAVQEMNAFLKKAKDNAASSAKFIEMMKNLLDSWIDHQNEKK